jgi:hypothetical protein
MARISSEGEQALSKQCRAWKCRDSVGAGQKMKFKCGAMAKTKATPQEIWERKGKKVLIEQEEMQSGQRK